MRKTYNFHSEKDSQYLAQQKIKELAYMPSCFPNGSSYWTPTQKPGTRDSALPTNLTTPLFSPPSTSHLSPTFSGQWFERKRRIMAVTIIALHKIRKTECKSDTHIICMKKENLNNKECP